MTEKQKPQQIAGAGIGGQWTIAISSTQALPAPSLRLSASRRRLVKNDKFINMV
jgi:hypothetical protein